MRPSDDHPLVEFVRHTFGPRFSDLLMAGYRQEPSRTTKVFHVTEEMEARGVEWVIELVSNSPPCRQEPLVLAALLKLLFKQPVISPHLEFSIDDLIEQIGWKSSPRRSREVDRVISTYAGLSFHKELKNKRVESVGLRWGQYSLITAYIRETVRSSTAQVSRRIEFAPSFIEGLKEGSMYFADINFGRVNTRDVFGR